ncbi:MAG TPA: response regulator transcription factor [Pseudolabrys sp.]|jgi:DNA-binding NarL/FixJ family response regulator|nr:response regulator transcription factor [Pseudolabrys sp.]
MVDPGETQQIIRIVIAEDNDDLRALLPPLLNDTPDLRCLGTTAQIGEVASLIEKHHADVAILDIQLRDGSALKHLPDLSKQYPDTRFLIHSGHSNPDFIRAVQAAGANAYIRKSGDIDDLIAAIRGVINR